MDIAKMVEDFFKSQESDEHVEKWDQIAKLTPEDVLRKRNLLASCNEKKREVKLLKAKVELVMANLEVESGEWWSHVYKTYGLPTGNYHIMEDGRVMREPENEK